MIPARQHRSERRRAGLRYRHVETGLAATVALSVVTVVTGVGMGQLFKGRSYLLSVLVVALGTHAACYALRRARRFPPILVGPLCVLVVALVSTWLVFPAATAWGIPVPRTWHVLGRALAQARSDFASLKAPVPVTPGFLWLACLGIGSAAVLADTAAFRLGALIEGVLPAFAVFLFTAGLGASGGRSVAVALWIAAVLAYFLVVEVAGRTGRAQWLTDEGMSASGGPRRSARSRGAGAMLTGGALLAVVAVLGAVLIGPAIPGARAASLFAAGHGSNRETSSRTTVSPLVDIKAELLSPSNAAVFTVSSPVPSYWRLTSLDTFNGTTWSANATYEPVGPALPSVPGPESSSTVAQVYRISGLAETWLPAAFRPVALSGVRGAGYNPGSASIIAGRPTYTGLSYGVTSEIPAFTAGELATARVDRSNPSLTRYLALPSSVPSSIVGLARRLTAGDGTAYAKAMALQSFFRDNFTYSLDVAPSESGNALVTFLFDTRAGYCQQFAGAYAVMARAAGLPSRVAVGFTEGQREVDGLYHVEALNAHAWPEVDLGAYGWVPFEPTPGRGEPGTAAYTGLAPAQAAPGKVVPATSRPATTAVTASPATLQRPALAPPPRASAPRVAPTASPRHGAPNVVALLTALLGAMALAVALLAGIEPLRRRRRWARATSGPKAALAAFADVSELLARSGRPRHPAETSVAYARRVAHGLPERPAADLLTLAGHADSAAYAPRETWARHDASNLRDLANRIRAAVRAQMRWHRRLAARIDPLPSSWQRSPPGWRPRPGASLVSDPIHALRIDSRETGEAEPGTALHSFPSH